MPSSNTPCSPTSRHGVSLNLTSPAHSNPFIRSDSLRSSVRTPSTVSSRHCLRKRMGANELPEFRAVTQPSDCLIQCFLTSAKAASCAAFSIPEVCPEALPVPPESDLPHPDRPKAVAASRNVAAYDRTEQFMGPTLSAWKQGGRASTRHNSHAIQPAPQSFSFL
jgi:hypothetical protein